MISFVRRSKAYTTVWPFLTRQMAISSSSKSSKWDQILDDIAKPLLPKVHSDFDLTQSLQRAMSERDLKAVSSRAPVKSHFLNLVTGLDTLTDNHNRLEALMSSNNFNLIERHLQTCKTESELRQVFDYWYYGGKLSARLAEAILYNRHCRFFKHMDSVSCHQQQLGWSAKQYHRFRIMLGLKSAQMKRHDVAQTVIEPYLGSWSSLCLQNDLHPRLIKYFYTTASLLGTTDNLVQGLSQPLIQNAIKRDLGQENVLERLYVPLLHAALFRKHFNVAASIVRTCMDEVFGSIGNEGYQGVKGLQATVLDGYYLYMKSLFYILRDSDAVAQNKTCESAFGELARSQLDFSEDDAVKVSMRLLSIGDSIGGEPAQQVRLAVQSYADAYLESFSDKISVKLLKQRLQGLVFDLNNREGMVDSELSTAL
jgi:hypothetical protein